MSLLFTLKIHLRKFLDRFKSKFSPPEIVEDPAYYDALEFIKGKSFITYNQLQKGLNIGYARTTRIVELLEKNKHIALKTEGKEKMTVNI